MPTDTIKKALTPSNEPDVKFTVQQTVGAMLRLFVPMLLTKFGYERLQQDGNYELLILGMTTIIGSLVWSVLGRRRLLQITPPSQGGDGESNG